jgi:predicted RecA/RadA family phage recombinase
MANKVRDAFEKIRTLKFTHSGATVTDTIYYLNGMILLAMNSALANIENVFICSGLIEYGKVEAQAWTGGQKIYWDPAAALFTNVRAIGCILAGYAAEARANPTTTGFIVLDPAMRAGSNPSHSIIAAGTSAAENDVDASVVIPLTGVAATDVAQVTLRAATAAVYVTKAVLTADTLTVTLSGNGGVGTQVDYVVARAAI